MGKARKQDTKIPAGPGTYFSDPSQSQTYTLLDLSDPDQLKRYVKLICRIWEPLRRNKQYIADFEKHFSRDTVVAPQTKRNQSKIDYFRKQYGVGLPLNPNYSIKEFIATFKAPRSGNVLYSVFLSFFVKIGQVPGSILTTKLMPIPVHHLTGTKITIRKRNGKFEYEDLEGNKSEKVDLSGVDTQDLTIRINLSAPRREIDKAYKRTITLWNSWRRENWPSKEKRNRPDANNKYLEVHDLIVVKKKGVSEVVKRDTINGPKNLANYLKKSKLLIEGGYREM